jgi:GNAT superfamily N-acetyltransferase
MMPPARHDVTIRRARPDEAEVLSALMVRSKAHWGYAPAFIDAYRQSLGLTPDEIEQHPVHCAEVGGRLAGVVKVFRRDDGDAELDDLFVEPDFIGQGVGTRLWQHAVEVARSLGATALVFDADPHARGFYERLGAVVTGDRPSSVVAGLRVPRLRCEL